MAVDFVDMNRQELKEAVLANPRSASKLFKNELLKIAPTLKEARWILIHDLPDGYVNPCVICGMPTKFKSISHGYFDTCGSVTCRYEKAKDTNLERYGVDNPNKSQVVKEKIKKTNLERYGTDNPMKNSSVREKVISTNLQRYGVKNTFGSREVQARIRQTNLERYGHEVAAASGKVRDTRRRNNLKKYGVESTFSLPEVQAKAADTIKERYGVDNYSKTADFHDKMKETSLSRYGMNHPMSNEEVRAKFLATMNERYGADSFKESSQFRDQYNSDEWIDEILPGYDPSVWNEKTNVNKLAMERGWNPLTLRRRQMHDAPDFEPDYDTSYLEDSMKDFLDKLGVVYVKNDRTRIAPLELDFWVPSHNLAIEMNGIYWHSVDAKPISQKKHQQKFNLAKQQGITLIQFNEIEWLTKRDICENIIKAKLGLLPRVYARRCDIDVIDGKTAKNFIEDFHIQGHSPANINLALWYEGEIVAVMTLRKSRYTMETEWELIRFCSSCTVVGGFSRLLKRFRKMYSGSIISYSNSNISIGDVYSKNGFEYTGQTVPSYFWFKGTDIKSRYQVQKVKLGYEGTEIEYMKGLGYKRYFDAGNERWIMK